MCKYFLQGEALCGRSGHTAGRQLLAQMMRRYAGMPLPEIAVTARGKPYFPHCDWHFSISHTPCHVFCALSRDPIGLDAEEEGRDIRLQLAEKILSPGELAQYRQAPDRRLALLRFWVLKEAQVKCSGDGLRGYPCHTDFSLDDPRVFSRDGCLVAVISSSDHTP